MLSSSNEGSTSGPSGKTIIDASRYIAPGQADCGIQKAIDAAADQGGGVVQLPEGRFVMERYLYLRGGVALRGKGPKTVLAAGKEESRLDVAADVPKSATRIPLDSKCDGLKAGMLVFLWPNEAAYNKGEVKYHKVASIEDNAVVIDAPCELPLLMKEHAWISWGLHTYLAAPAVLGERTIAVAHPELLAPGYAVWLSGRGDVWGHHFNVVTAIDGNQVRLDRPLTVNADQGSLVQHGFAMITADGEKGIGVADLVIEGWGTPRMPRWVGLDFCLSGIHTVRCDDIEIRNVEVRHWHSDGVSIQRGKNAVVDSSAVIGCRGRGFHPGTTFDGAEFTNLRSIGNGLDGVYYCYNNTNVNVRNSVIKDNIGHGIGGLGDPGDRRATIEGNTIEGNGLSGIEINGGGEDAGTAIRRNVIRDNSRLQAGAWAGIAIYPTGEPACGYLIEDNTIESTLAKPTQLVGVEERNGDPVRAEVNTGGRRTVDRIADRNTIRGNRFAGHAKADVIVVGAATKVQDNGEAKVVSTSPAGG